VSRGVRRGGEDGEVTEDARATRTARLLVARLDAVARIAGQLRHAEAERLVEIASIATMRAVALELIRAEQADEIWRDAHARHPQLPQPARLELPQRLAA
jgi:ubiquinone biosynthesis protein COQ9